MTDGNIITVTFDEGQAKAIAPKLWQWDYGQFLRIEGLTDLPDVTEVHFAQNGASLTKLGTTVDDICTVEIPNAMLRIMSQITAYIYLHTGEDDGETVYEISVPVKGRPQPETYDEDDPEIQREYSALVQATELLNQTTEQVIIDAGEAAREAAEAVIEDFRNSPLYPSDGVTPNN